MRFWTELVAAWSDVVPLPLTVLLLILAALLIGLLWYFWPSWWRALTRRGPRRERKPKTKDEPDKATGEGEEAVPLADDELPDLEPVAFTELADRFAAEGHYAEAVRERLRAMVRELVDQGVITHRPGWTVTELAEAAGAARPAVRPPMTAASGVFSEIWYGRRPALSEHDTQMRLLAQQLHAEMSRR